MPKEKFYHPATIEGQELDGEKTARQFAVAWGDSVDDPHATPVVVAGIPLDRSGINRLIATLRRARNATYGADE